MVKVWTPERIAEQHLEEIRQRFEQQNQQYRADCQKNLEWLEDRSKLNTLRHTIHDSHTYSIYKQCRFDVSFDCQVVNVLLPADEDFDLELLSMFAKTSVSYMPPTLSACIEFKPHLRITTYLVDRWDDEDAAESIRDRTGQP